MNVMIVEWSGALISAAIFAVGFGFALTMI